MKRFVVPMCALAVWWLAASPGYGQEVFQKYRISFTVSDQAITDGLQTNATNVSSYLKPEGGVKVIADPRPDSAEKNEATIKDAWRYDLELSYGMWRWKWGEFTLDTSVGYVNSDVGSLEVSAQFNIVDPPRVRDCGEITRYHLFFIPLGQMTQVPVQLGGTVRFRPRAAGGPFRGMKPYLGAGVGYIFTKFEGSDEFFTFSSNVSKSFGYYQKPDYNGGSSPGKLHQFKAAQVETPDTFEYYLRGGIDFPLKKGFTILFMAGFMWADAAVEVTTDGRPVFGSATPPGQTHKKYPLAGLPAVVQTGGFIDYASGRPVQREGQPCKFKLGPQDGLPDTGNYYVQGGDISYSGYVISLGARYQF